MVCGVVKNTFLVFSEDDSEKEGLRRHVSAPARFFEKEVPEEDSETLPPDCSAPVRSSAEMSEAIGCNPQTPEFTQGQQANNVVGEVEDATPTDRFDGGRLL